MATSRYDTASTTGTPKAPLSSNTNSNQQGSSTTQGTSNTSGTSDTTGRTSSVTNTSNMTPTSLAALETLIQQLMGGGTQTMQVQSAQRQQEIAALQGNRGDYSKEAAFNDAQGLISQTMRQTLESLLPGINRAAAGSGASAGSMRALLLGRAQETAAQNAAAAGLGAAVNYGQVANGTSGVIASLLNGQQDTATQALLQALQVARGAVTNSTTNGTSSQTTNTSQNTNTNQQTNTNQNNNTNTSVNTGGGGTTGTTGRPADDLVYFGPSQTTAQVQSQGTGSTLDTLLELAGGGGGSGWSNGFSF